MYNTCKTLLRIKIEIKLPGILRCVFGLVYVSLFHRTVHRCKIIEEGRISQVSFRVLVVGWRVFACLCLLLCTFLLGTAAYTLQKILPRKTGQEDEFDFEWILHTGMCPRQVVSSVIRHLFISPSIHQEITTKSECTNALWFLWMPHE